MKKRGIGIGCMYYGIGYGFSRQDISAATIEICEDGSIICRCGEVDYGQGSDTILCQIIAEELGVKYDEIQMITADTFTTPNAGPTSASRVTFVTGQAVLKAVRALKKTMNTVAEQILGQTDLVFADNHIHSEAHPEIKMPFRRLAHKVHLGGYPVVETGWYDNTTQDVDPDTGQGDAYAVYSYATQLAEVEVDTETGKVEVLRIVAAHDVGKALNPSNVEAQIEGGIAQGVGYALEEEIRQPGCRIENKSLVDYMMPTSMDMPEIEPHIIEVPAGKGPYGAKGVGEPALIPTAPAILNAICNALDVRITDLPANLENMHRLIRNKEKTSR